MGAVNESLMQRMTLGTLCSRYGLVLQPDFASPTTITSLADDLESVRPGALYVPLGVDPTPELLRRALNRGAYAVLAPIAARARLADADLPVLYGDLDARRLGQLAAELAGKPSDALAMFGVVGPNADETIRVLSEFLHVLGNPVGRISAKGSYSLDRELDQRCPLNTFEVQHSLAVCAEDGAAAVVVAVDAETLHPGALSSVSMDVVAVAASERLTVDTQRRLMEAAAGDYGFEIGEDTHLTWRTSDSDMLAMQASGTDDRADVARLSTSIAMVMGAGVRRSNIKNALRVSRELS
ncbi:UDP-N-acetylmuramyl peptide synthase [Bifidobacterium avesanii]|uniref:UDP-N-acetylmuramyl peptide synthase n=1 Tax=Bifidobacterium avesanii TaxID=1798157 RepID=A0A7K3TIU1_9BIFI|nr:UDP-N-acetylmuramyl peptide synthase [Bifidobacterium avesanii]KAB8289934.1 UDP-N-acetylmuramoylalanyl-D-glutamate--2, 6-diaminopimelate ligase [Bifidobacterium avesanii]NEG78826.1 UDP-N-acetylmuramyl peptide synthase [Bifidobacterium avesanii]